MIVTCETCGAVYNDTFRLTYCPHDSFAMNTIYNDGHEETVCHSLAELNAAMQRTKEREATE